MPSARRLLVAVLVTVLMLTAAGRFAGAQTLEKVSIAVLASDSTSQAWVALDRGTFRRAGLDVSVDMLSNGPAIAAAVAGGSADVGAANLVSLATAYAKGIPFVLVAPAGTTTSQSPTVGLIVAKNAAIAKARDLNGKTIGVDSLKSLATTTTAAWMDKNGGDSKTLKFIEIPIPQMGAALDAGRVDAAFIPEPLLSRALAGNARLLATPADAISSPLLLGAWFTTSAYAKAHPDVVRKIAAAMAETGTWINANPGPSAEILQRYTKIAFTDRTHRMLQGGKLDAQTLQPLVSAAARYGALEKDFPAAQMIAPELAPAR